MHVPISVRIQSYFARDKHAFWWNHFTDEEKQLRRMDAWQLARVIHEESIRQTSPEKRIVAEHLLNVRLAQIQAKASKWSGWLSLLGAVLAALVSFQLGQLSANKPAEMVCACNCRNEQPPIEEPVPLPKPPVVHPDASKGGVAPNDSKRQDKQSNGTAKP
jgi:hypothetical protein